MTDSHPALTQTEGLNTVGTTKRSSPRPPYHISASHGLLQARLSMTCPDNEQCASCATYLHGEECQYKRLQHRCDRFNHVRIPARFEAATMEALQSNNYGQNSSHSITKATQWLLKWCVTQPLPQKGLILYGTQGTGKSFAMAALCRHLTLSYATLVLFLDFQQFIRELKYCYHKKDNDYQLFDNLRRNDVLILDDVQPTRDSPWIQEVLHTIISQRYNDCSTTFLTTNLSMTTEFKAWASAHTYSRLKQMCYWLPFNGQDRRGMYE